MTSVQLSVRTPGRQPLVLVLDEATEFGREVDGMLLGDTRSSRRHARIEPLDDGTVRITDLGSSNGTTIDGEIIAPSGVLVAGGIAVLGDTVVQLLGASAVEGSHNTVLATVLAPGHTSIDVVADSVTSSLTPALVGVADEPGTLTVVFSDIESSTQQALRMGDTAWFSLLQEHTALVRAHVQAHRGRIIKNQGDGFMLAFRSARQALLCTVGLQRDLIRQAALDPENAIRVRVGAHTGEVLVDDDGDIFGRHVMIAARIGGLANGGQICVSSLVKQIAEPRGDIAFVNPTECVLKGIDQPMTVYEVDWENCEIE